MIMYVCIYIVCIFSSSNTFFCRYEDDYEDEGDDADKEAATAAAATTNKEDGDADKGDKGGDYKWGSERLTR